jgi:hypothetical protein
MKFPIIHLVIQWYYQIIQLVNWRADNQYSKHLQCFQSTYNCKLRTLNDFSIFHVKIFTVGANYTTARLMEYLA